MTGAFIAISLITVILFIGLTIQAVEIKKLSSKNKELNDIYLDHKKKSEDSKSKTNQKQALIDKYIEPSFVELCNTNKEIKDFTDIWGDEAKDFFKNVITYLAEKNLVKEFEFENKEKNFESYKRKTEKRLNDRETALNEMEEKIKDKKIEKNLGESKVEYQPKKIEVNFDEVNKTITDYFSTVSNCNGSDANSFIGLHYERYVATLLFKKGYRICYNGAISGYDDGGIDLIAYKNKTNNILIQCKYYSQRSKKKINEKLIKKIKDNMKKYKDKHPDENYKMSLFSSKNQCNKAKSIANKRPVLEYNAGVFIKDRFPIIKFNRETGKFFYPEPYKIWSKKMEDARRKHLHYVDEYDKIEADPSKIDLCLNADELKTLIDNYNRNNLIEGTLPI